MSTTAAPAAPARARAGTWWHPLLAGLAVGLLSLAWSWHPSLWSDEAATVSAASRSLPELWDMLGTIDLVHGAYYAVMHVWTSVFGTSAVALRLPSALAAAVTAGCTYGLGARLRGPAFGAAAVAVLALLPRAFWAGAEARPYAGTAALAAAATLALLVALDRRSRLAWAGYAVLLFAGVLANLYVGLLVGAHLATVRLAHSEALRRWLVAAGAAVLAAVPFLLAAYGQAGQLGDRDLGPLTLFRNVVANQWFLGDTPTPATGEGAATATGIGAWWLPASLLLAAGGWALIGGLVLGRRAADRPLLAWTLPWVVLPTAVIGFYSLAVSPMYSPRYLTFAAPAVALLLAAGLLAIRPVRVRAAVAVLLVLAAVPVLVSQRQLAGKNGTDWSRVAAYVDANARPGDAVYYAPRYDLDTPTYGQSTRGIAVAYPDDFAGLRDLTLLRTPADADNLVGESQYLRDSADRLSGVDTVWVVRRDDWPDAGADDAFLTAQGFTGTEVWRGPLDVVLRFTR